MSKVTGFATPHGTHLVLSCSHLFALNVDDLPRYQFGDEVDCPVSAEIAAKVKAAREDELRQFGLYLTSLPLKDESPLAFLNIMAQIGKRAKEIEATK